MNAPPYTVAGKEVIAMTPDLRVTRFTLAKGQGIPWHTHSVVTDSFFCLKGQLEVRVKTAQGAERNRLGPGDSAAAEPGQPHEVVNVAERETVFLTVQGVGAYDFVPVAPPIDFT